MAVREGQKLRTYGTGSMRRLPSGRVQARFSGPDGVVRPAPFTFDSKIDAEAWLKAQARDVERGTWAPPVAGEQQKRHPRLKDYAAAWLAERDLKPSTRALYRDLLDAFILDDDVGLDNAYLDAITVQTVRHWYAGLSNVRPTRRAHAYSLLRTILKTAYEEDLIPANPCRIRGAGSAKTAHPAHPATLAELEIIVSKVPARYKAMMLLAAWCALRFGELTELRRGDVDLDNRVLRVTRGVVRVDGAFIVGDPKSDAGKRTVAIPPHLVPVLKQHLTEHTGAEPGALLFPAAGGGHMRPSTLYKVWYPARDAAGRSDLHFHDLRHTGATLAAATGATLAELMARLGHSTPAAAMRYQHAAADRDRAIADALSKFAGGKVVPLHRKRKSRAAAR